MTLSWGQWIIDYFRRAPNARSSIAVVRHSERPDFKNIPVEKWNTTSLTENGKKVAMELGSRLVRDAGFQSLTSEGWGLDRCVLTARLIAEGAYDAGCRNVRFAEITELPSPVANEEKYGQQLRTGKYREMIEAWLAPGTVSDVMTSYDFYTVNVVNTLLDRHLTGKKGLTIVATHDLHILPLIRSIFGLKLTAIDFLDGIIISRKDGQLVAYHDGSTAQISISHA